MSETLDAYAADFERLPAAARGGRFAGLRKEAMEAFLAAGFPTTQVEDWRYTSVLPIAETRFAAPKSFDLDAAARDRLQDLGLLEAPEAGGARLVFVNGRFSAALSEVPQPSVGVLAGSLAEALSAPGGLLEDSLGGAAEYAAHPFALLNTAFAADGAVVSLSAGCVPAAPIRIVHVALPQDAAHAIHSRTVVVAAHGSRASVVETWVGPEGARYFSNPVTEIALGPDSSIDYFKVQREGRDAFHVSNLRVRQGRGSRFAGWSIGVGGALVRNDVSVLLDAEGAECALNGLYLAAGRQHVDNHTLVDHARPRCKSAEVYKGVLDGSARAVFNGKVLVRQDAQKTDATQSNRNLLLSPDASVDTKPQLEIYADDVKCAHGAAVGQLDADALFYLRSRGLNADAARAVLTYAFAGEIVEGVPLAPIRESLDAVVHAWLLAGGAGRGMSGKRGTRVVESAASVRAAFDVRLVRKDFPILDQEVHHGKHLVYLDNAATSQKPQVVMDALGRYYGTDNANVHRGVHRLSERATEAYEGARRKVRAFLNAGEDREIVFVRGTTEGINLVAQGYGRRRFKAGDEVILSEMEHHSNIVPWQMLRDELGIVLRVIPMDDDGALRSDEFEKLLSPRTRFVSVVHVSNALGTVNPVKQIVRAAHARGVPVLLDGAQAVPHLAVDVRELDCDFYVFSGHKLYGPTGIGILYGKAELLEAMSPYQGGGDMIRSVTFEKTTYNAIPYKFEAGTPHISGAIALGVALDWLGSLDREGVAAHEEQLLRLATARLQEVPGVRLIGTAREKLGVVSFVMDAVHPHDIGTVLDLEGIAIRTGHHCAQPVMLHFKVPATARASFALYNTAAEIDALVAGLHKVREVFG